MYTEIPTTKENNMPDASISMGYETIIPSNSTPSRPVKFPVDQYSGGPIPCVANIECAKLVDSNSKGNVGVRWTDDGSVPTTVNGMELNPGDKIQTCVGVSQLQFIGVAANSRVNIRYSPWPPAINQFNVR